MLKSRLSLVLFAVAILLLAIPGRAESFFWDKLGFNTATPLTDTKIGSGLKEALRVGIDKTVDLTGKPDGYFANPAIKILMPERLKKTEGVLRKVGFGPKLDEFELSMNRAAEKAAPYARDIFIQALLGMSFDDVQQIYKGGDTAATDFFKRKTSTELVTIYKPIVTRAMTDYGVTQHYQTIAGRYNVLPLAAQFKLPDIEDYVVTQSLNGLFKILGEQESAIRHDPAAQVTKLLKEVFQVQNKPA